MIVYVVTGAPGSGKTTAVQAFIALKSEYLAFDIDWLIESASALAQRDIRTDGTTWPAYGRVWFDVLRSVHANGRRSLFFTPNTPEDLETLGILDGSIELRWILLDCPDLVRQERLEQRTGWDDARIKEALEDAAELRELIDDALDTSILNPSAVANHLLNWVKRSEKS